MLRELRLEMVMVTGVCVDVHVRIVYVCDVCVYMCTCLYVCMLCVHVVCVSILWVCVFGACWWYIVDSHLTVRQCSALPITFKTMTLTQHDILKKRNIRNMAKNHTTVVRWESKYPDVVLNNYLKTWKLAQSIMVVPGLYHLVLSSQVHINISLCEINSPGMRPAGS